MKHLLSFLLLCLTMNGFSQWTPIAVPTEIGLNDAFFVDENTGYIVGGGNQMGTPDTSSIGIILKTIDGGLSWSIVHEQNGLSLNHIYVVGNVIYAYGKLPFNQDILISSEDDGISWPMEPLSFNTNTMDYSDGMVYVMQFSNDHMQLMRVDGSILSILADSVNAFGVNGSELLIVDEAMDMHKSIDHGATWHSLDGHPDGFGSSQLGYSSMKSFGDKLVLHYTYPNFTCFSLDNGAAWTVTQDDAYTNSTIIMNSNTIYSFFNTTIAATFDLLSWSTQFETAELLRSVYFFNDSLGFALCNNGRLYRTTNGGIALGVNGTEPKKKIRLHPNPTQGSLIVQVDQGVLVQRINLYDLEGALVRAFGPHQRELNVQNLAQGQYVLRVHTDHGTINEKVHIGPVAP